jgi:hypothetical protein
MNYKQFPPWQSMDTAPKDRDILILWKFTHPTSNLHDCTQVGLAYFNGIFEEHHPGSGFWNGHTAHGHVTSRANSYKPIAWMELPPIQLENI